MLLQKLQAYIMSDAPAWQAARDKAFSANPWFEPVFIHSACQNIAQYLLDEHALKQWTEAYQVPDRQAAPKTVGITMAGNIPLVGFHDWLTIFTAGHRQVMKPSSKDEVLIKHLVDYLTQLNPDVAQWMRFEERLNGCDAYIATGSNNTSRYFEYYFGKYPHIIRKNRTSAALLTGTETPAELKALADDMLMYFGLGCRNVSKLYVPEGYDFVPLLQAMDKYSWMKNHSRFRNNYEYNLSLLILNNVQYMSNEILLFTENEALFSPVAQVHYTYYAAKPQAVQNILIHPDLQCLCGDTQMPFGMAQSPVLTQYADGVDTLAFAMNL